MLEWIDFIALMWGRLLMMVSSLAACAWLVTAMMDYFLKSTGIWLEIVIAVAERRRIKACKNGEVETQPRAKQP